MEEQQEKTREEKIAAYWEQKEEKKQFKKRKILIRTVVCLLLICSLLALWVNRQRVLPENAYEKLQFALADMEGGDGYPHSIKGNMSQSGSFVFSGGRVALLSDTAFEVLNRKGTVVIEAQNSYESPAVAASETRYLIYGIGGKKYKIESVSGTVREEELDQKILAADISEKGKYILATESASRASEIAVYNGDGSLQYTYKFSSCYVTDVSISSDGKRGAVCGISSENGILYTEIYLFDFGSEIPVASYQAENTVFFHVEYGSDAVVYVGQSSTVFLDPNTGDMTEYSYGGETLISYDTYGGTVALALTSYNSSSETQLFVVEKDGTEKMSAMVEGTVRDVSLYGDVAAVLTEKGVQAVSTMDGSQIAFLETEKTARRIELGGVDCVYILNIAELCLENF